MEEEDECIALPLLLQTAGEQCTLATPVASTSSTALQLHTEDDNGDNSTGAVHTEDQNMQCWVSKCEDFSRSASLDREECNTNTVISKDEHNNKQPEVIIHSDTGSIISSLPGEMCRICHCYSEDSDSMISPCGCDGSMKYVHQVCLQKWVKARDTKKCELCGTAYNMTSSVKPFRQWKKLDMSSVERRKVLCSVTFHVVAITCVIWSLYVLIDKTAEEINDGRLNWPFWTKLVVVAIGFTGGLVFMYVQCKMYVQLFKKWKQFNRVIYINDIQVSDIDAGCSAHFEAHGSGDGFDDIVIIHMNSITSTNTPDNAAATTTTTNGSNSSHDAGNS